MKQRLKTEMKVAMKAKDRVTLDTIRSILSAMQYEEMQKGTEDLSDADILVVLKTESKKRKESMEFAQQAGRENEIEQLAIEIAYIDSLLPKQLSEAELESFLQMLKKEQPEITMGLAMKELKERFFGQYDGALASRLAKKVLD